METFFKRNILVMKNLNLKIMRPVGFHARVHEIVKKAQKNVKENSGWKINSNCPVCFSKKKNSG